MAEVSDGVPLYGIRSLSSPLDDAFICGMSMGCVFDCADDDVRRDNGGLVIDAFRLRDFPTSSRKSDTASLIVRFASESSLLGNKCRDIC